MASKPWRQGNAAVHLPFVPQCASHLYRQYFWEKIQWLGVPECAWSREDFCSSLDPVSFCFRFWNQHPTYTTACVREWMRGGLPDWYFSYSLFCLFPDGTLLLATGVIWALRAQSGKRSPKWVQGAGRPRGGRKKPKQSKKSQKAEEWSILSPFRLCFGRFGLLGPLGLRGPGNSFRTVFAALGLNGPNNPCRWDDYSMILWCNYFDNTFVIFSS